MEYAQQVVVEFLSGKLDIVEFRRLYDEKPEIDAFLQKIIDDMKKDYSRKPIPYTCLVGGAETSFSSVVPYLIAPETDPHLQYCPPRYESVRQMLTYEFRMFTHDVETASGASSFYNEVYEYILKLINLFRFAINIVMRTRLPLK